MGSGLILLVIVAAWLAVLVPMALRSHDANASLSSVDRFSDAMRVLSRRDAAARARHEDDDPLSAQAWAENDAWDDEWDDDWDDERIGWRERLGGVWALLGRGARAVGAGVARVFVLAGRLVHRERTAQPARAARVPAASSPAVRRRRALLTLVALTVASAVAGVVGPRVLLVVAVVLVVAVALFVVQLRRLAVTRAARARRAPSARPVPAQRPEPARSGSVRVQPADVPAEPEAPAAPAVEAVVASPAVRHDEPVPAAAAPSRTHAAEPARPAAPAAALGAAWSPVPVPPPIYVNAPVAPARAPRIVDLTRPGSWSEQESARAAEELPGGAPASEPAPERRRAVNEW